jgi:hypothetical protein
MLFCCPIHDTRFETQQNHNRPSHDKGHPECPLAIGGVCYAPGREPAAKAAVIAPKGSAGWGSSRVIASGA